MNLRYFINLPVKHSILLKFYEGRIKLYSLPFSLSKISIIISFIYKGHAHKNKNYEYKHKYLIWYAKIKNKNSFFLVKCFEFFSKKNSFKGACKMKTFSLPKKFPTTGGGKRIYEILNIYTIFLQNFFCKNLFENFVWIDFSSKYEINFVTESSIFSDTLWCFS